MPYCSTASEECLDGKLRYPERPTERSLRDAVHFYCRNHPWAMFGQDLLLGSEADIPATGRELEFAPLIMQQDFTNTVIIDPAGTLHIFAGEKHRLVDLPPIVERPSILLSPLAIAIYLLIAVLALAAFEWRRGRIIWPVDTVLLLLQGLAGLLVAFLFFFSTHLPYECIRGFNIEHRRQITTAKKGITNEVLGLIGTTPTH